MFAVEINSGQTQSQRQMLQQLETEIFESLYEFSDYYRVRQQILDAGKYEVLSATFGRRVHARTFTARFSTIRNQQGESICVELSDEGVLGGGGFKRTIEHVLGVLTAIQGLNVRVIEPQKALPPHKRPFDHNPTYTSLWFEDKYEGLTPRQGAVVKILDQHWKRGHPEVSSDVIKKRLEAEFPNPPRMGDIFRSRPGFWRDRIGRPRKGYYSLKRK